MLRKFLIAGLCAGMCAVVSLAFPVQAQAVFITSNGTVQMAVAPGGEVDPLQPNPPLLHITELSATSGRLFTNQVDGAPFQPGSTVRTVGTMTISQAVNGTNQPARLPDGSNLIAIFAVEGTIQVPTVAGQASAQFHTGRVFFASSSTGNPVAFEIHDPSSWNFANAFASYSLLARQPVVDGADHGIVPAGDFEAPASDTNVSAVNTQIISAAAGLFLFGEDSTAAQNAGLGFVNPGLGPFTGDNFLRDVEVAADFPLAVEGFVPITDQTALNQSLATYDTQRNLSFPGVQPLDPLDLAMLNAIAAAAGLSGPFATGLGGPLPSDFNPTPLGAGTGDFIADISAEFLVGYQAIPEPTSMALFGLGAGVLGLAGRVRRQRSEETAS